MEHAQQFPTQGESRVMECMVYADHARQLNKRLKCLGGDNQDNGQKALKEADEPRECALSGPSDIEQVSDDEEDVSALRDKARKVTPPAAPVLEQAAKPAKVLKKPFFKNWNDFMDFDASIKHKMPITFSEFELLLEKERESTEGWDVCVERKEIRVAKVQTGVGCITLRAWATLPNVKTCVAFYLFHNTLERVKWDKVFAAQEIIDANAQGSDVLYSLMKVPGVTPRDFLQYRRSRVQEDGSILIVLRSAEHLDKQEDKNVIRAESYISGYVLRQGYEENGEPVLKIFLMSCADVKGLIPKWIISYFAPKKPGEWVDGLRKACMQYQIEHPNYEQELAEYMRRFRADNPYDYEAESNGLGSDGPPGAGVGDCEAAPRA